MANFHAVGNCLHSNCNGSEKVSKREHVFLILLPFDCPSVNLMLIICFAISYNGQTHFKNLAAFAFAAGFSSEPSDSKITP